MEIQARVVLLIVGIVVLAGVTLDFLRRRNNVKTKVSAPESNDLLRAVFASDSLEKQASISRSTSPARTQMEPVSHLDLDFELETDPLDAPEIVADYVTLEVADEPATVPDDLFCINVMSRHSAGFDGEEVYNALTRANCHCVDNVFYRYAEDYGGGDRLFSVLQAVEPGIFNIETIAKTKIPGITFIFQATQVSDPNAALEQLIRTAKQVGFVLNGELLDLKRNALTLETIAEYRNRIKAR